MEKLEKENKIYSEEVCGLLNEKAPFILKYGIACILISVVAILLLCIKCGIIPHSLLDSIVHNIIKI